MMSKKTVLIVEDDISIRRDLCELLTLEGYEVLLAENGEAALTVLRSVSSLPDLVLLDITMPIMDGWAFRAAQMQDPALAALPVVVMTADGHAPEKAKKMNAAGFVRKPIGDIDVFLSEVARLAA
jgi:two-component system response regulator MprA